MLRVRLLGELELEAEGEPVALPSGRPARTLLAWLALHPGMHPRSRLAGTLWPEVREDSARTSLRAALAAIRRALGTSLAAAVVSTRDEVGMANAVWVDARAFDELAARGRLEEALALCRGELVPSLGDDWAHEAREEHRARWAAALAGAADVAEARGDLELAVGRTRDWVHVDPLAEEAHRALIRRLDARGERAAALTAYARLRERFRRELGLAPSPETRALVERLRTDEVAAVRPPLPAILKHAQRSPFVGRASALTVLAKAWKRAQQGDRQLVLVAGEPGIGKTRLAAEFARTVYAAGATVLLGRSYEEPIIAYQPFAEALRPYLLAGDGERGQLERLVPGLARTALGDADPQSARFRAFEAVSALLLSAARDRPALVVLDDLHWADHGTLLLLAHLMRVPDPARLLVVGTYREEGVKPGHPLFATLASMRREQAVEHLALRGLAEQDVAALVQSWTGPDAPPELAAALHRETEGNPFFVEELLQQLGERVPPAPGVSSLVGQIGMPQSVKDVIAQRLTTLSADAREVVGIASVIGRDFDASLIESLPAMPRDEPLIVALDECLGAALIRDEPGEPGRYRFAHPLIREAVYDGLGAARRAKLHAQVAHALQRRYGPRADHLGEIASHLVRAPGPQAARGAVSYAAQAGELAIAQLAYEQAATHFELALAAVDRAEILEGTTRCELLLALGDARMRSGERDRGRLAFADAAAAARGLGRGDLLGRAALGFGGIGVTISEPDDVLIRLLEEAVKLLGNRDGALRARLLARLAVELYYAPERSRADSLSAQALTLAERAPTGAPLAEALSARHVALWTPDHVDERLAIADEMVTLAEGIGDTAAALQARNWRILDLFEIGDRDRLEVELDGYARLASEARLPAYEWYAPMWRATLALLDGRLDDVPAVWAQARALGARGGDANADLFFRIVDSYHLPAAQRRFDRVDINFHREQAHAPATAAAYRVGLARILAELGRRDEAHEELDRAAPNGLRTVPRDMNWLATLAELAQTCALLDDAARAAEGHELLLPYAGLNIIDARAIYCYGSAAHYLGLYASTIGRSRQACEHYEIALRFNRSIRAWPHLCHTLVAYAKTLLTTHVAADRAHAAKLAAEAAEIADRLAIPGLINEALALTTQMPVTDRAPA
jgi:DNA-binding SARP family transcriptional activator/tetratricopeptide (TPR) repeat protein